MKQMIICKQKIIGKLDLLSSRIVFCYNRGVYNRENFFGDEFSSEQKMFFPNGEVISSEDYIYSYEDYISFYEEYQKAREEAVKKDVDISAFDQKIRIAWESHYNKLISNFSY